MKDNIKNAIFNTILSAPDSEVRSFIEESLNLADKYPEIIEYITRDQDQYSIRKKESRIAEKQYITNQTADLFTEKDIPSEKLDISLEEGRPRMSPHLVLLFVLLRGYWGSVTDKQAREKMKESISLYILFNNLQKKLPAPTTILENINIISNSTRDFIFRCGLEAVLDKGLDDFSTAIVDSTAVKANSSWPTDSGVILRLLERSFELSQKLSFFGLKNIQHWYVPHWLKKLKKINFKINNTVGKANSKAKIKKLYRLFLNNAHKVHAYLVQKFTDRDSEIRSLIVNPGRKRQLIQLWDNIENDLLAASPVLYYAGNRIFNNVKLPSTEKILSLSDLSAAFIKKGQRDSVIGYKPQLAQSGNGFITALIVKSGNIADSQHLLPLACHHAINTGVIPEKLIADDGYSSQQGKKDCESLLGIEKVCLSGSVGKKITDDDLWDSEDFVNGRKQRSAVESTIFTLKYVFNFGALRRRGIEDVKAEMLEKVIAHNIRRMIQLEQRKEEELMFPKTG